MMRKLTIAGIVALAITTAGYAAINPPKQEAQSGWPQAQNRQPGQPRHGMGQMGRRDPGKIFDMMDANHDGSVSRLEFTTFHEKMKQRRMERGFGGPGGPQGQPPQD